MITKYVCLASYQLIEYELEGFGIRLNKEPPNITFRKKDKGGINLTCAVPQSELDLDLVKGILAESRIHNADVILRSATAISLPVGREGLCNHRQNAAMEYMWKIVKIF